jgi:hypothetical protein
MNATHEGTIARLLGRLEGMERRRFVALALVLGLLVHGTFALLAMQNGWTHLRIDEVNVARRIQRGLGFAFNYYGLFDDGMVEGAFFPPAYVYNALVLLEVFESGRAIVVQNVLLSLGVSFCLYALGRRLLCEGTARVALLASLVYPPFFTRVGHGSPVYFKMFFMVLLVMALQRLWTRGKGAAVAGVLGGLLALAMPDVLVLLALFAAALLLRDRFGRGSLASAVVLLAVAGATISPWTVRNRLRFGETCLVSSNGGFNFYMGNNPDTRGEVDYATVSALDEALDGELRRADEFGRDRILYREGVRYIVENKAEAAGNFAKRAVLHWFYRPENLRALSGQADVTTNFRLYIWSYALTYVPLALLALLGFLRLRGRWGELTPLWLTFVYSTAIATAFVVQTKMRLIKVEPFLMLFAADWVVARFGTGGGRDRAEA